MDSAIDHIQQGIASYASEFRFDKLPPAAVHAAKIRVIDTLSALIAGFFGDPCRISRRLASLMPSEDGSTVIGTGFKTFPDMAAFVNGITAREAEMMDFYHWPGSFHGHPSDALMPIFSVAELCRCHGRILIENVVLAYEIFCRIADVFKNPHFDHTNFACLAVAVASGKLFKLSSQQLMQCISMAIVPNNMLYQTRVGELSMYKVTATGQAGRAGIHAAMLARAGMQGPSLPFVGASGWCEHVAGSHFKLPSMGDESTPFKILDTQLKSRPAAAPGIASILAAEKIGVCDVVAIKRVIVEVYDWAKQRGGTGEMRWNPQTRETADHSIPYVVAATLLNGTVTPESYKDSNLWNPKLRNLMQKIEVVEQSEFTRCFNKVPVEHRARVTVHLGNGDKLVGEANEERADDAQVTAKFRQPAEDLLGRKRTDSILESLWHMEEINDVSVIPPMLAFA